MILTGNSISQVMVPFEAKGEEIGTSKEGSVMIKIELTENGSLRDVLTKSLEILLDGFDQSAYQSGTIGIPSQDD